MGWTRRREPGPSDGCAPPLDAISIASRAASATAVLYERVKRRCFFSSGLACALCHSMQALLRAARLSSLLSLTASFCALLSFGAMFLMALVK